MRRAAGPRVQRGPRGGMLAMGLACVVMASCTGRERIPAARTELERQPERSGALTREAARVMTHDPARAESLLREALEADLFNGNAHNNLGVLHLERGELYEAATRFEMARKLMPDHPDPRLNLAMTYERAGRIEEAMRTYEGALACAPSHLPTLKARTRCQIRHGRVDETTAASLREIALRGDEAWSAWARTWMLKIESGS